MGEGLAASGNEFAAAGDEERRVRLGMREDDDGSTGLSPDEEGTGDMSSALPNVPGITMTA